MIITSTDTVTMKYPKPLNWCEDHDVEHAWEGGPYLTSNPPIETRVCSNCGKMQQREPARWIDY